MALRSSYLDSLSITLEEFTSSQKQLQLQADYLGNRILLATRRALQRTATTEGLSRDDLAAFAQEEGDVLANLALSYWYAAKGDAPRTGARSWAASAARHATDVRGFDDAELTKALAEGLKGMSADGRL